MSEADRLFEELEKLQEEYGEYCLQGCENCEWYEE